MGPDHKLGGCEDIDSVSLNGPTSGVIATQKALLKDLTDGERHSLATTLAGNRNTERRHGNRAPRLIIGSPRKPVKPAYDDGRDVSPDFRLVSMRQP